QYNRFWQRAIAEDRPRFDEMTALYEMAVEGDPDTGRAVQQILGIPDTPAFVEVDRSAGGVLLRLPVYTDIEDDAFLRRVEALIEERWRASEGATRYAVDLRFRLLP